MERDINTTIFQKEVLGFEMKAVITRLPQDIHVLLTGGILPHTGSVSIFESGNILQKTVLPGHKDDIIGDQWAKKLSLEERCLVTVVCGIHYDHATADMLREIQLQANQLLKEVMIQRNTASK